MDAATEPPRPAGTALGLLVRRLARDPVVVVVQPPRRRPSSSRSTRLVLTLVRLIPGPFRILRSCLAAYLFDVALSASNSLVCSLKAQFK